MFINQKKFVVIGSILAFTTLSLSFYGYMEYQKVLEDNKNSKESDIMTDTKFFNKIKPIQEIEKKEVKESEKSLFNKKVLMSKMEDRIELKKDFLLTRLSEDFINLFIKFNRTGKDVDFTSMEIIENYFTKGDINNLYMESILNNEVKVKEFIDINYDMISKMYMFNIKKISDEIQNKNNELYKNYLNENNKLIETEDLVQIENNKTQLLINRSRFEEYKKEINSNYKQKKEKNSLKLDFINKLKSGFNIEKETYDEYINEIFNDIKILRNIEFINDKESLQKILFKKFTKENDFKDFINIYLEDYEKNIKEVSVNDKEMLKKLRLNLTKFKLLTNKRYGFNDLTDKEIEFIFSKF